MAAVNEDDEFIAANLAACGRPPHSVVGESELAQVRQYAAAVKAQGVAPQRADGDFFALPVDGVFVDLHNTDRFRVTKNAEGTAVVTMMQRTHVFADLQEQIDSFLRLLKPTEVRAALPPVFVLRGPAGMGQVRRSRCMHG
jgi:hypothetical protein